MRQALYNTIIALLLSLSGQLALASEEFDREAFVYLDNVVALPTEAYLLIAERTCGRFILIRGWSEHEACLSKVHRLRDIRKETLQLIVTLPEDPSTDEQKFDEGVERIRSNGRVVEIYMGVLDRTVANLFAK